MRVLETRFTLFGGAEGAGRVGGRVGGWRGAEEKMEIGGDAAWEERRKI